MAGRRPRPGSRESLGPAASSACPSLDDCRTRETRSEFRGPYWRNGFRRYLSETPIAYLTRWRLQLGAQMLTSTSSGVAQIAAEVGYESEPPLTAPSNVSSAFRRPNSVLDQEQSEEKASVVPWPRSVRCGAKDSLKLRLKEREQATSFLSA